MSVELWARDRKGVEVNKQKVLRRIYYGLPSCRVTVLLAEFRIYAKGEVFPVDDIKAYGEQRYSSTD